MIATKSIRAVAGIGSVAVLTGLFLLWANSYSILVGTAAAMMAILTVLNLRFGRTLLYPPAMLCAVWTLLLTCLVISGNYFFRVSWQTFSFYLMGAAAFSLGGWANRSISRIRLAPIPQTPGDRRRFIDRILTVSLVLFVSGIPFYWNYAQQLVATSSFASLGSMVAIRDALIKSGQESGVKSFSQFAFDSFSGFSILVVFLACLEDRISAFQKWRYYALIGVALFFNLGTAGRVGAFYLAVGLVVLSSLRRGGINYKLVCGSALLFVLAFAPAAILMNKGGDVRWSLSENTVGILGSLSDYSMAGLVSFDRIVQNPDAIPPVWRISRSFLQIANRLGVDVYIPSIHAEFSEFRPGFYGNAYTMYFAYLPDFGWYGTMLLVFCLGAVVTWVYRRAIEGNRIYAMLFGLFGCYLVLSGFNENFFAQLNFNLKCVGTAWICYSMPLSWVSRRNKVSSWRGRTTNARERFSGGPAGARAAPAQPGTGVASVVRQSAMSREQASRARPLN